MIPAPLRQKYVPREVRTYLTFWLNLRSSGSPAAVRLPPHAAMIAAGLRNLTAGEVCLGHRGGQLSGAQGAQCGPCSISRPMGF